MRLTETCPKCGAKAEAFHTTKVLIPAMEYEVGPRGTIPKRNVGNPFTPWHPLKRKTETTEQHYRITTLLKCAYKGNFDSSHRIETTVSLKELKQFKSIDETKEAWTYQQDGIRFAAENNYTCLFGDEMGLGKTIQAALAIRNSAIQPVVILVRSSTTYNWIRELTSWASNDDLAICTITSGSQKIIPGFQVYLMSMDLFGRNGMWKKLLAVKPKMIVCDESHSFKDPGASRTKALIQFCKEGEIKHKLFLSGTSIKNKASEYFTVLNLLDPVNFPSYTGFATRYLADNGGLRHYVMDEFHRLTSKYIIRRTKAEVMPDLPPINHNPVFIELEDEWVKESYNQELDLFSNWLKNEADPYAKVKSQSLLGWLAKIRAFTGKCKTDSAVGLTQQFLEEIDGEKLALGIHHVDVRDSLYYAMKAKGHNVLKLSGEDSASQKDHALQEFKKPENRLLIINMLSGGLGLNIQFCSSTYILEPLWSSADELQYIGRFHRPGQTKSVTVDSILAVGTIDQWMWELKERKRKIFGQVIDGLDLTNNTEDLRWLVNKTLENRL